MTPEDPIDEALKSALDDIGEAEHELADAERSLEDAKAQLAKAEEVERHSVEVHFKHLGENERASFRARLDATLQTIWDQAYIELEIERTPRDVLQAPGHPNPTSLMNHLSLTFDQARHDHLCENQFEIAAGTGGA